MVGFYGNWKQTDLVKPYFEKFYEILPLIYQKQSYKYLETFFYNLLPRRNIRDEHIVQLVTMKL